MSISPSSIRTGARTGEVFGCLKGGTFRLTKEVTISAGVAMLSIVGNGSLLSSEMLAEVSVFSEVGNRMNAPNPIGGYDKRKGSVCKHGRIL
jgi:hypothetical protein